MEGVVVMFSKTKTDLDPGILLDLQILLSGELLTQRKPQPGQGSGVIRSGVLL